MINKSVLKIVLNLFSDRANIRKHHFIYHLLNIYK